MDYLEIKAPAKINLGLNVVSKRQDGYHNIETIFYPLEGLYDKIFIKRADYFSFSSNDRSLDNEHNLIVKAKDLLEQVSGTKLNVSIELEKHIPIGAGLGGGSSDAATVLVSLNEMFSLSYNLTQLRGFGLAIGSDVPFFIKPKPSFASGRGEVFEPVGLELNASVLIVNPGIHISTKEAYQNISPKLPSFNLRNIDKLNFSDRDQLKCFITNDFEDFAFRTYPVLKDIKESLYGFGAKFSLMTGSGSTIFALFDSKEDARLALRHLPASYFTCISQE